MIDWFRRCADIPGMVIEGLPDVDPSGLPGYGIEPDLQVFDFGGEHHESLVWRYQTADGVGGRSPTTGYFASEVGADLPLDDLIPRIAEALALPGEPSSYHFGLLALYEALWPRRRQEPAVLPLIETLCWIDVHLTEAWPAAVSYEREGEDQPTFYTVPSFERLIDLYTREGAIREALEVAERASHLAQELPKLGELRERVVAVENEARE